MSNSLKILSEKYERIIKDHERMFDETIIKDHERMFNELSTNEQNMLVYLAFYPDKINKFELKYVWVDDHMFCYGLNVNGISFGIWWVDDCKNEEDRRFPPRYVQEFTRIEKQLTPKNKNVLATKWLGFFLDQGRVCNGPINLQDPESQKRCPELQKHLAAAEAQIEVERLKELGSKQAGANIDF